MSIKTERLSNVLLKEISDILFNEVKDQDINFVTITHVNLTSDLSFAKIYFTVLDNSKRDICTKALNRAKSFIRSELIKRKIEMRKMPELKFVYDESIEYGNKIEEVIKKIHEED